MIPVIRVRDADPQASPWDRQRHGESDQQEDGSNERNLLAGVVGDLEVGELRETVEGEAAVAIGEAHRLAGRECLAEGFVVRLDLAQTRLVQGEH